MIIVGGREVNNMEEAFELLTEEQKAHARRVAQFTEIAYKKAVAMGVYVSDPRAEKELQKENSELAYKSGLWHDIGKIQEETFEKDHTRNGEFIVTELFAPQLPYQFDRRMILQGVKDHHERMNGLGGPEEKKGDKITFLGRIVAIADILDNKAVLITSEDPVADALKDMKQDAEAGFIDDQFFKAFTASRAALKKAFRDDLGDDLPIPEVNPWVKRRQARPMNLLFKQFEFDGKTRWYAEMRFKGTSSNDLLYSDVKNIIKAAKLGAKLSEYFVYELCDALRRFEACSLSISGGAVLVLPSAGFNSPGLAKAIAGAIEDEGLSKESFIFGIPEDVASKPSKTASRNIAQCKEAEIRLLDANEIEAYAEISAEELEEEEIIVKKQIAVLQRLEKDLEKEQPQEQE